VVRGKVIDPDGKLSIVRSGRRQKPFITCSNPITAGNSAFGRNVASPIEMHDGVGQFEIRKLLPGPLTIAVGGKSIALTLDKSIDDLVIDLSEPKEGGPLAPGISTRTVVLKLQTPEGWPAPKGELRVDYSARGGGDWQTHWLPIEDGQVSIDLPAPGRILYETGRMLGYCADRSSWTPIDAGDKPMVIAIPTIPAGAITGRVLDVDGAASSMFAVSAITVKKSLSLGNWSVSLDTDSVDRLQGRFMISPVPIGGEYRVVATCGDAKIISPRLKIDRQKPIHDIKLRFVEGVTVSGQLLDPDGSPASGINVRLGYSTSYGHGASGRPRQTDRLGRFRFEHVNPEMPVDYHLRFEPRRLYQGVLQPVTPNGKPMTIRLKKGLTVSGVLIDHETGWPIPNATMTAWVADYSKGEFNRHLKSRTDSTGRFRFTNMAAREYRLLADGTVPSTAIIRKNADGTASHVHPGGEYGTIVTGGQPKPITVRVKLTPNSKLRPMQPESEVVAVPAP